MQRVLGYIGKGQRGGREARARRQRVMEDTGGFYIEPTVFDDVAPGMSHFAARRSSAGAVAIAFDSVKEERCASPTIRLWPRRRLWTRDLAARIACAQAARRQRVGELLGRRRHDGALRWL
jgi:hypothetical protein